MFQVRAVSDQLAPSVDTIINQKTKPLGALGKLESLARQVALIQQSLSPQLTRPAMLVFAADHGVAAQGVSPFPQEVTAQMVLNFIAGGAAINVFCRQNGFELKVINAGVATPLDDHPELINRPVKAGTEDFTQAPAMSSDECQAALELGASCADQQIEQGTNVMGFGEMGIANTTSSTAIMAALLGLSPKQCVGRGAGLDSQGVSRKEAVVAAALEHHQLEGAEPLKVLQAVGGLEIAAMVGAMLRTAERGSIVLIDGFIATAAALLAVRIAPECRDYMVFCHGSAEQAHRKMLEALDAEPLLDLGMRLGEGSGVAVAYPLLKSAVAFFNEMASFESAGVANSDAP